MSKGRKPYLIIGDEHRAYLEVDLQDIQALGLTYDFSPTSFMDDISAYLDMENTNAVHNDLSDGETFLSVQASKDIETEIELLNDVERVKMILSLAPYTPYFVENPLNIGAQIQLSDGRLAEVTGIEAEAGVKTVQIQTLASDPEFYSFPLASLVQYVQIPEFSGPLLDNGASHHPDELD